MKEDDYDVCEDDEEENRGVDRNETKTLVGEQDFYFNEKDASDDNAYLT